MAAPVKPSSLIKVSRYTMLVAGILYGSTRHSMLKKQADAKREQDEKERPAREAQAKAMRDASNREQMAYLASITGVDMSSLGAGPSEGGSSGTGGGGGSSGNDPDHKC